MVLKGFFQNHDIYYTPKWQFCQARRLKKWRFYGIFHKKGTPQRPKPCGVPFVCESYVKNFEKCIFGGKKHKN